MTTKLTAKAVENVKATDKRQEIGDGYLPGLYLVVQPSAGKGRAVRKSWAIRYRHEGKPKKMTLGPWAPTLKDKKEPEPVLDGPLTLAGARTLARDKLREVAAGIDPAAAKQAAKATAGDPANSFNAAFENYVKDVLVGDDREKPRQRSGPKVERDMRRDLVPRWGTRELKGITKADVVTAVNEIKQRGARAMGRNVLGHCKSFFAWCDANNLIEHDPAVAIKPRMLLGKKPTRKRVLTDLELCVFWRASGRLGYPFAPLYRVLLLTGQRREEVAAMRWAELHPQLVQLLRKRKPGDVIDWAKVPDDVKLWAVGSERFKSDVPQRVPLSADVLAILAEVPIFKGAVYVFSTTGGARPVSGFSKIKARLDRMMVRIMRALARLQGDDPEEVALQDWVNHDLRRTLRTRLSSLKVPSEVAELVIGHAKEGLDRVYDQYEYEPEMREALVKWAARLREILAPPPSNVIQLHKVEA